MTECCHTFDLEKCGVRSVVDPLPGVTKSKGPKMLAGVQVGFAALRGRFGRTVIFGSGRDILSNNHEPQFQRRHAATESPANDEGIQKLTEHIKAKIMMRGGPVSLAEFMQDALTSPHGGYYMNRDVFGAAGDFTTSPEISQMFGEMVGIWTVHTWMQMGQPPRLNLVELGPGRGTLMADLIRGTARFKQFIASLEVHLVEVSPALRSLQWTALKCQQAGHPAAQSSPEQPGSKDGSHASTSGASHQGPGASEQVGAVTTLEAAGALSGRSDLAGCQVTWHDVLDSVPAQVPTIYVAHEFFDALPVHQFVKDPKRGWLEKMVDVADQQEEPGQQEKQEQGGSNKAFRLVLSPSRTPASALLVPRRLPAEAAAEQTRSLIIADQGLLKGSAEASSSPRDAGKDEVQALEVSAKAMAAAEALALRVGRHGGAALIIDYGQDGPYADSLVALRNHKAQDVLVDPGSADLSAWVDFGALRQAATQSSAAVTCHGPASQAHFLLELGIEARLEQLLKRAKDSEEAEALRSGFDRITGTGPKGMGLSYKAMAIAHSSLQGLVGFGAADR